MTNFSNWIRSRSLSLAAAIVALFVTYLLSGSFERAIQILPLLLLAVTIVCFCDELGTYTGIRISEETPGIAVAIGGWLLLTAIVVAQILMHQ